MAKRPDAARGYAFGHKRDKVDADWREIVDLLNDLGPPVRNLSEWKKVKLKKIAFKNIVFA